MTDENLSPNEKRACNIGCLVVAGLLLLLGSCFNAVMGGSDDEDKCAEILAKFEEGAGTFSYGAATEDEIRWAMDNDCPGF